MDHLDDVFYEVSARASSQSNRKAKRKKEKSKRKAKHMPKKKKTNDIPAKQVAPKRKAKHMPKKTNDIPAKQVAPTATTSRTCIRLGTFFSGLETPSVALVNVGLPHKLIFAIEKEEPLRKLIASTWAPHELHADVLDVDLASLSDVDIVVGGPPCQPLARGVKLCLIASCGCAMLAKCPSQAIII